MVNIDLVSALQQVLKQVLRKPGGLPVLNSQIAAQAGNWLTDPRTRKNVAELLVEAGLDKSALEAEPCRVLAKDLELLERRQAAAELHRSRAFRLLIEYRTYCQQLPRREERVIDAEAMRLEDRSGKKSAVAA